MRKAKRRRQQLVAAAMCVGMLAGMVPTQAFAEEAQPAAAVAQQEQGPAPTEEPAAEQTPAPTKDPAAEQTPAPTKDPAAEQTPAPTEDPAAEQTPAPTEEPAPEQIPAPTEEPAPEQIPAPAEDAWHGPVRPLAQSCGRCMSAAVQDPRE